MTLKSPFRPDLGLEDLGADNPLPLYAAMREDRPVCSLNTPGMCALSRYDDVKFAMEQTDLFSASGQRP